MAMLVFGRSNRRRGGEGRSAREVFDLALLEQRLLYCVDHGLDSGLADDIGSYPAVYGPVLAASATTNSGATAGSVLVTGGVPSLSSNPAAAVKLYLDFDGAAATTWGSYSVPATPAYDQDGDATAFSDAEQASIREIWARVAEKYSPFNLDVTTVDPGSYPLGKVLRVVVGGAGAWSGGTYGGLSYVGSFTAGPNTSWVFPQNLGGGNAFYTAEAIAHESGHGFGLQHQSTYNSTTKTAEYNTGDSLRAPIMGSSYFAQRGLWWNGTSSVSSTTVQDDMARIAATSNGFGYRADDHGSSLAAADALLTSAGGSVTGSGIIERTTDADYFKFITGGGTVSLFASVVTAGATLDLKLALYSSGGALVASADTASLGESLTLDLAPGTYYLSVASEGNYGDVGQYTLSGTVPPAVGVLAAPSGLGVASSPSPTTLAGQDATAAETGFLVQRSDDGGQTWYDLATVGANVTTWQDAAPPVGGQWQYRVRAFNASTASDFSNAAGVWGTPAAPASLTATAVSASQVAVTWAGVDGATGYVLQRSTDGGATWVQVATTSGTTTAYQDTAVTGGKTYAYRVLATNAGGASAASPAATVTTPALSVPTAPSNLLAVQVASNKVRLTWTDTSANETGFRIEYSTNGTTWTLLTNVAANTTTYTASGLRKNVAYSFRVSAYNAVGSSPYTAPAKAAPAAKASTLAAVPVKPTDAAPFSMVKVLPIVLDDPAGAGLLAPSGGGKRVFLAA
jgi:hypothetical protein